MSYDIVFDLDGTLVDSVPVCASIVNAMLVDCGGAARVSWAETREQISVGGARMIAALMGEHCGDSGRAIAEFRERCYLQIDTPASCLFPGVREGIEQLAGWGYRLSICSSKPQNLWRWKVLCDLGLADRFAVIVGSQPNRPAKPDPALYTDLLALIGGDLARSCLVGDSALDHALADRAGASFILAAYGYTEAGFSSPR